MIVFICRVTHFLRAKFTLYDALYTFFIEMGFCNFFTEFFLALGHVAYQFNKFALGQKVIFERSWREIHLLAVFRRALWYLNNIKGLLVGLFLK
jgi:hypothetical protein